MEGSIRLIRSAIHNYFFFEAPRIFYMHVHGYGRAADIVAKVKPALAPIGKSPVAASAVGTGKPLEGKLDTESLAKIIGTPGEASSAVYKITIGRPDINMVEMGRTDQFAYGAEYLGGVLRQRCRRCHGGCVAMLDREVQPVLKALRANGIDVMAMHHHMIGTTPDVFFLHYWGRGPAQKLAAAVRAAVDQTARPTR